jgi:D-alanyl-D-alanine carboxypeptidase
MSTFIKSHKIKENKSRDLVSNISILLLAVSFILIVYFLPDRIFLGTNNIFKNSILPFYSSTPKPFIVTDDIVADSYVVYDVTHNTVLSSRNENKMLPLASVSKLMTAYIAMASCNNFLQGKLDDLLVISSNEAADEIAANCPNTDDFINTMNKNAVDMHLHMTFLNPSGLDIDEHTASNYGDVISTAKLLATLQEKYPELLEKTTHTKYKDLVNTNEYASNWPFLSASKTGFTDLAGGNLATVFEPSPGEKIVIVVFKSSKDARFTDVFTLLKNYLKSVE